MAEREQDEKMLTYLKALGVPPISDLEEMKSFMEGYGSRPTVTSRTHLNPPRISIFFGEENKGEASYETWAYEVNCLKKEGIYPEEILMQSIRRSLRGHASDELRYLGERPSIDDILNYFESTYGVVDTSESILQKFFACKQDPKDTVLNYCSRLEDIHSKAIQMKALDMGSGMLKRVFYRGLSPQLKHLSAFKFETIPDYREFKKQVRQIENEIGEDNKTTTGTKTKCQAINKPEEKTESPIQEQQMSDLMTMMQKLNTRLENLEQAQQKPDLDEQQSYHQYEDVNPINQQQTNYQPGFYNSYRGRRQNRGPRGYRPRGQGPFRGQGRGENSYQYKRPIAGNNFVPECYICHERGHIARECTQYQPECYVCHQYGHYARNCPLNT